MSLEGNASGFQETETWSIRMPLQGNESGVPSDRDLIYSHAALRHTRFTETWSIANAHAAPHYTRFRSKIHTPSPHQNVSRQTYDTKLCRCREVCPYHTRAVLKSCIHTITSASLRLKFIFHDHIIRSVRISLKQVHRGVKQSVTT